MENTTQPLNQHQPKVGWALGRQDKNSQFFNLRKSSGLNMCHDVCIEKKKKILWSAFTPAYSSSISDQRGEKNNNNWNRHQKYIPARYVILICFNETSCLLQAQQPREYSELQQQLVLRLVLLDRRRVTYGCVGDTREAKCTVDAAERCY